MHLILFALSVATRQFIPVLAAKLELIPDLPILKAKKRRSTMDSMVPYLVVISILALGVVIAVIFCVVRAVSLPETGLQVM
jgi:hypothetical protein